MWKKIGYNGKNFLCQKCGTGILALSKEENDHTIRKCEKCKKVWVFSNKEEKEVIRRCLEYRFR